MRIPASKVYRAFPEFDRFDDARCEAYMTYVRRTKGNYLGAAKLLLVLAGILFSCMALSLSARFAEAIARWLRPTASQFALDDLWLVCMGVLLVIMLFANALILLTIRDVHLRSILRRQIKGVRCQVCNYSLLGMPVNLGFVQCPECGDKFTIALRGLRDEDFRVGADELPGLDELAVISPPAPKPVQVHLDPAEKERMLQAVRERRGTITPAVPTADPPTTQPPSQR